MGRARSIRVRIYLLLAIPLITVAALYSFVVATTVGNAINLDRAPSLINAVAVPMASFDTYVQNERQASMVYLAHPSKANQAKLTTAQDASLRGLPPLRAKLTSPGTMADATAGEAHAIRAMLADVSALARVRQAVDARAITAAAAFSAYSKVLVGELGVYLQEVASLTNAHAAVQGLANIDMVQAREYLLQENALLSEAMAAGRLTRTIRVQFTQLAGARQSAYASGAAALDATNLAAFEGPLHRYAPAATLRRLTALEDTVAASRGTRLPVTATQWNQVVSAVSRGYFAGGVNTAEVQVAYDRTITSAAWTEVWLAGGLGLLGLAASVIVSGLVARRLIRRLNRLGNSARALASEQLPDVVARLRRGEEVDETVAAPPMQLGRDELGQVAEAFDMARRTAIAAAVDEAQLRRGINEVFRNLARRSQSLLHRQLAVLDGMERRTSDPSVLEDLFRLDHLTTRMRRHAEGLIILSGAPPGRGWNHPVRLIDVLRGAAAEVEDYARVSVVCASHASLTGPAVADVIHLLAELIENATTLSPPYTTVRVTGDLVAKGFVVEVEDRGLGVGEERLAELNDRLASPPEFSLSNSEQLGLFVVARLAHRHGIQVTMRPSPYGGITAIVLVPADLVVVGDDYASGLPAGSAAVWSPGRHTVAGPVALTAVTPGPQLTTGPIQGVLTQGPDPRVPSQPAVAGPPWSDAFSPAERSQGRELTAAAPDAGTVAPAAGAPAPMAGHMGGEPTGTAPAWTGEGDGAPPLPRRVRQASLAPQLRAADPPGHVERPPERPQGHPEQPPGEPDPATSRSPEEIREAMSALQRGWERGRAPWEDAPPPPGLGEWERAHGGGGAVPGWQAGATAADGQEAGGDDGA